MISRRVGAAAIACGLGVLAAVVGPPGDPEPAAGSGQDLPNIVVIMTDDQTITEQPMMETVGSRIGARGATFVNSFTNLSLCCPSRATFLTGQYAHNHRVRGNGTPEGGYPVLDHQNTLPVWLRESGYYTALIGKYLNMYESQPQPQTIPPGWSFWNGSTKTYSYYDFQLNENGALVDYGDDPGNYQTDVYTAKAVDLIEARAPAAQPFFLWLNYLAPHAGGPDPNPHLPLDCTEQMAKPAPRHASSFDSAPLPQPPSFNEADVSDKPSWVQGLPLLTDIAWLERAYRCRLESTQAADEGVGAVLDALAATGELDDTYVIYTSDNGFMLGEHRMRGGKNNVYEPAIRVPLMIRGPGIRAGEKVREMVINADLAPTIVSIAGAHAGLVMDGRSLLPVMRKPGIERGRELLIHAWHRNGDDDQNVFAVRTQRYLFALYENGEREMYDLEADPFELENVVDDPAYERARVRLASRLVQLRRCDGVECRLVPEVELRVAPRRLRRPSCRRRDVIARLEGPERGGVERLRLQLGGSRVARDDRAPFGARFQPGVLRAGDARLHAVIEMIDGRRRLVERVVRACRVTDSLPAR